MNAVCTGSQPGLLSKIALIDPALVRSMPQNIAAWTGFDAFAHGFESFLCKTGSQFNIAMQLRVMKLVSENLREFTCNRMNHQACENMCWAESMAIFGMHMGR